MFYNDICEVWESSKYTSGRFSYIHLYIFILCIYYIEMYVCFVSKCRQRLQTTEFLCCLWEYLFVCFLCLWVCVFQHWRVFGISDRHDCARKLGLTSLYWNSLMWFELHGTQTNRIEVGCPGNCYIKIDVFKEGNLCKIQTQFENYQKLKIKGDHVGGNLEVQSLWL